MKLKTHHTTIPAEHGWYRCSPIFEGDEVVDIYHSPVIAWVVTVEELDGGECMLQTHAVVADEIVLTGAPEYLRRPNGSYVEPEGDLNMTGEDLIARMQQHLSTREGEKIS